MPCFFCVAMVAIGAAALSASGDELRERLAGPDVTRVESVVETGSVHQVELDLDLDLGRRSVPVRVTRFLRADRVRVEVLTHDIDADTAAAAQDRIVALLDGQVVSRSDGPTADGTGRQEPGAPATPLPAPPAAPTETSLPPPPPYGSPTTGGDR